MSFFYTRGCVLWINPEEHRIIKSSEKINGTTIKAGSNLVCGQKIYTGDVTTDWEEDD